jgi:S1-C subfamily serine protease
MNTRRLILSCLLVAAMGGVGLMGAVGGGAAVYLAARDSLAAAPVTVVAPTAEPATDTSANAGGGTTLNVDINSAVQEAVAQVSPAVVTVVNYVGRGAQGSGSGVIISPDGYIVTNNHVVEGFQRLEVIYQDGSTVEAELVGADPFADVAVIKVSGSIPAYAEFGNSDALSPGETVIAIGSPLGDFRNTVTVGVVSATGRSLDTSANYQMEGLIQTDAAINRGNSGGPLVNLAGQVVGINTLVVRGNSFAGDQAEGLGFAVASNIVSAVAQQLIEQGYVARPYLGIEWTSVTPALAARYGLAAEWGAYVQSVAADSPAQAAGLREGDIITAIDGLALGQKTNFINTLWAHAAGDTVALTVMRDGQTLTLNATLGERPRS